jgi:hypothetical protein
MGTDIPTAATCQVPKRSGMKRTFQAFFLMFLNSTQEANARRSFMAAVEKPFITNSQALMSFRTADLKNLA